MNEARPKRRLPQVKVFHRMNQKGLHQTRYHIFLVSSQCLDHQKSLLLQLKGSLQYDSTLSNKLARWNHNTSECGNWDGVTCNLSGHVIALELDNQTISSGIENSTALFSLQYLERLNLAYNMFNVGVPVGIDNLTNLKYLNLSNAGFVGQIPMMLSRLTKLVTLDLSTLFPDFDKPLKLENPNLSHFIENSTELRELYVTSGKFEIAKKRLRIRKFSDELEVVPVMVVKFMERSFQRHRVCSNPSSYERVMALESWAVDKKSVRESLRAFWSFP
ncbi:hypothetical protein KY289_035732 [Solanum tuberosum]|nr:hypothetical protein KY289_035732 [Solanum tuberosum]